MIPAHELYQHHVHRQHGRIKTYNVVLKRLENRILQTAKMDQYECEYEVPTFIVGEPMYEVQDCVVYLYMKLHRSGYKVKLVSNHTVRVSWRRYDDRAVNPVVPVIQGPPIGPQGELEEKTVPVAAYQALAFRKKVTFDEPKPHSQSSQAMTPHVPAYVPQSRTKTSLPSLEQLLQQRKNELR